MTIEFFTCRKQMVPLKFYKLYIKVFPPPFKFIYKQVCSEYTNIFQAIVRDKGALPNFNKLFTSIKFIIGSEE